MLSISAQIQQILSYYYYNYPTDLGGPARCILDVYSLIAIVVSTFLKVIAHTWKIRKLHEKHIFLVCLEKNGKTCHLSCHRPALPPSARAEALLSPSDRAHSFQLATNWGTPSSLVPSLLTHLLPAWCSYRRDTGTYWEGPEVWVSRNYAIRWQGFIPFFSPAPWQQSFLTKICLDSHNLNSTEVKETVGGKWKPVGIETGRRSREPP